MAGTTTLEGSINSEGGSSESSGDGTSTAAATPVLVALVVVWSAQPERIGELLFSREDGAPRVFGRGEAEKGESFERVQLVRQRPGATETRPAVEHPFLSRQHLKLTRERRGGGIHVENLGKRPLRVNGEDVTSALVDVGDTVSVHGLFTFLCTKRPAVLPGLSLRDYPMHPWGLPDPFGIVGESPLAWHLRDRLSFFAGRKAHVLITGASGTGKELAAQATHALSDRRDRKLVSRNAATLPASLIDAELFGNAPNYPQAGMAERPGLIGEAHESTLFLDEIGELPSELQTHLLRVLDDGEYQRLGDAKHRRASFRLIAATNRPKSELKPDVLARLVLRLEMPDLNARREDIALIARHILRRTAAHDPDLGVRFFNNWDGKRGGGDPRLGAELVRALVTHTYSNHVRELEALLWISMSSSRGGFVDLTDEVRAELASSSSASSSESSDGEQRAAETSLTRPPTAEEVRAALARHHGVRERVWRELGLGSRHALHRLLKKYGIDEAFPL